MNKENINLKTVIEEETGKKFNRANKITCPFHQEKTPSFSIKDNKYKCFGCGVGGDVIDFIKDYKNVDYIEACNHLKIELDNTRQAIEIEKDLIIKFALSYHKEYKFRDIFPFTDEAGKVLYYKIKLVDKDNNKITPYYSIQDNKLIAKRGSEEIPYNLPAIKKAIEEGKKLFIVEGEKDVETLKYYGYKATSLKGLKDTFNYSIFAGAKVYFIADTGEAGSLYKNKIWFKVKDYVSEFNIVEPDGLEALGDNKDITDWFEAGHTINEFKLALKDSWDWKKSTEWKYVKQITRDNEKVYAPIRVWQNLELLLNRENINLKYNVISKEVEATGNINSTRNILLTDIYTNNLVNGLNMSREEVRNSIGRIAEKNSHNPFLDYLKENENTDRGIIADVFLCLDINGDFIDNIEHYQGYFVKWCLNVVRQAHNTLEKAYESQGVLTLQGKQGCFKSTFFKKLLPNSNWFKGGKVLDPTNKDSIRENTKYIMVELGELDGTFKHDQAKLKAFITTDSDEYRSPYATYEEKHPRITTFCATVNKMDFLKDETGSRRWWIIPVEKCNIAELEKIDINKFWGAVYNIWKSEEVRYYLSEEETKTLNTNNLEYASQSDISITLDESFDWEQNPLRWVVYNVTEICDSLNIKEKKSLKNELERRGISYKNHKNGDSQKKGYKLPKLSPRAEYKYNNNPNKFQR